MNEIDEEFEKKFDNFLKKYKINLDNYNFSVIMNMDIDKLDQAFENSLWLKTNMISFARICREYQKIIGGYYQDYVPVKKEKKDESVHFGYERQYSKADYDSCFADINNLEF